MAHLKVVETNYEPDTDHLYIAFFSWYNTVAYLHIQQILGNVCLVFANLWGKYDSIAASLLLFGF